MRKRRMLFGLVIMGIILGLAVSPVQAAGTWSTWGKITDVKVAKGLTVVYTTNLIAGKKYIYISAADISLHNRILSLLLTGVGSDMNVRFYYEGRYATQVTVRKATP